MDAWKGGEFDAIVAGSGPGGASVARALSREGKRVLILERGGGAPVNGTIRQTVTMGLLPGRGLHVTSDLLALVCGITVGGSSILAYATAFDPPYEVFDAHGVDLRGEVDEVKRELPVAPLADSLVGPAARRIAGSARELGFNWASLPKIVYQERCRSDCDKCAMGCPHGAKWTARMYVEEACTHGATLVTGARVAGFTVENDRVTAVTYFQDGDKHRVTAPVTVLAAGGIGTPELLRSSGIKSAGSDFFFDPLVVAMGTVDDLDGGREFPMAMGLHDPDEGYVLTDLVFPRWMYSLFAAQVLRFDRLAAHGRTLPIMVKVRDDLSGRLTEWGGVAKRLTNGDRGRLARGYHVARRILENAGAHHIFQTSYLAAHPGGTAKIGDVVDANLRTKFANLYVCDCSVIPQSWGLPPTLTLLALGNRLAKHLLN